MEIDSPLSLKRCIALAVRMIRCVVVSSCLATSLPLLADSAVQYSTSGTTGAGLVHVPSCFPFCGDLAGGLQFDTQLTCTGTGICRSGKTRFLQLQTTAFFRETPPAGSDRSIAGYIPEQSIPFARIALRALELPVSTQWRLALLNTSLDRNHPRINEISNFQVSLGMASLLFGERTRKHLWTRCGIGLQGPGFKRVDYSTGAISFSGLGIFGFEQDCKLSTGSDNAQFWLGYALRSNLAVGQSGSGVAGVRTPGDFGAILSESRLQLEAGLWFSAPNGWNHAGIAGFSVYVPVSILYYMNRGCLTTNRGLPWDPEIPLCGNNTNGFEVRIPVFVQMHWGIPAKKGGAIAPAWNFLARNL